VKNDFYMPFVLRLLTAFLSVGSLEDMNYPFANVEILNVGRVIESLFQLE
jgi:hypothetical protein